MSPLIFKIEVDVISQYGRKGLMNDILYADDLILMSKKGRFGRELFEMEGGV